MPDLLLALLLGLVVLVAASLALRWAARAERRADERYLTRRVFYPKRGRKADRPAPEEQMWPDDVDEW